MNNFQPFPGAFAKPNAIENRSSAKQPGSSLFFVFLFF